MWDTIHKIPLSRIEHLVVSNLFLVCNNKEVSIRVEEVKIPSYEGDVRIMFSYFLFLVKGFYVISYS